MSLIARPRIEDSRLSRDAWPPEFVSREGSPSGAALSAVKAIKSAVVQRKSARCHSCRMQVDRRCLSSRCGCCAVRCGCSVCNPIQAGCYKCLNKYIDGTCGLHVSSAGDASVSSTSTAKSIGRYRYHRYWLVSGSTQYLIPVSSEP